MVALQAFKAVAFVYCLYDGLWATLRADRKSLQFFVPEPAQRPRLLQVSLEPPESTKSAGFPLLATASLRRALPNPSLKLSPNGVSPGPGRRYVVHSRHPGPGATPLVPA